ncbi:CYTH domain-containing protein [Ruminococcaceae bacterium YRB3002]|nr:CYTH domain-containing protein [Ruminococcaceae bacterium YRB3002]
METEVKIAYSSDAELLAITKEEWFTDYCMDEATPAVYELDNTYYDTPDRVLSGRGAVCRVRTYKDTDDEECYEHTVKYGDKVDNGLYQRYEWNVRTSSRRFDVDEFKNKASRQDDPVEVLDEALDGVDNDNLSPLCRTVFTRTVYTFGYGDSIMEACFDVGRIEAGDKTEDICELELELISGDVVDLKDMAAFILENTNGTSLNLSKFQRSLKLLDSEG